MEQKSGLTKALVEYIAKHSERDPLTSLLAAHHPQPFCFVVDATCLLDEIGDWVDAAHESTDRQRGEPR